MNVLGLIPGDAVPSISGEPATFVAQTEHPIWRDLRLVIWKMPDGSWSHDALSPYQVVGDVIPSNDAQRAGRLWAALIGRAA